MSEVNLPFAWELTDSECDGTENAPDEITLGAGQTVTCTFTNTKQTAWLRLQKDVGGGSAKPEDWLLTADAAAPFDGKNIDKVSGDNVDYDEVYAGVTYKLSESDGPANYTPGDKWVCVTDEIDDAAITSVVDPGDEVSLEPGEYKTCTIVNSRNLAQLKLVKQVKGKNAADDWTLSAKAVAPDDGLNFSNKGGSGKFEDVYAGTEYTLSETGPGGYSPSDWVCLPDEEAAGCRKLKTVSSTPATRSR